MTLKEMKEKVKNLFRNTRVSVTVGGGQPADVQVYDQRQRQMMLWGAIAVLVVLFLLMRRR